MGLGPGWGPLYSEVQCLEEGLGQGKGVVSLCNKVHKYLEGAPGLVLGKEAVYGVQMHHG